MRIELEGILLAGVLFSGARFLSAQSFGDGDQALHLGATAFRPFNTWVSYYISSSDGYLYRSSADDAAWVAPLTLPAGAEIYQVCLYAYDPYLPESTVWIELETVKLAPGGQLAGIVAIPGTYVPTSFDIGHGVTCSNVFSYTYRDTGDPDADGNLEHVSHRIRAGINADGGGGLGGVRVFWRRQASPAPPIATFADVPTGHGFFQFIEALAASSITAGCGGANFCPDSPLTRGQMAVFLSKALGLHWPY